MILYSQTLQRTRRFYLLYFVQFLKTAPLQLPRGYRIFTICCYAWERFVMVRGPFHLFRVFLVVALSEGALQ